MARRPVEIPRYCRQKKPFGGDLAFVEIGGRRRYLGLYGTPESKEVYHRLLAEVNAFGTAAPPGSADEITIVELGDRFLTWAKGYYLKHGKETTEPRDIAMALRPLVALYGRTKAAEFGPRALKAVRQEMIDEGNTRKYINRHIDRIKRMFKWAVAEELLPPSSYEALRAVAGLKAGRSEAPDAPPVKPVPLELVEPVKAVLSRQLAAVVDLQLHTGARPSEILCMRGIDIDTSGPVWTYTPWSHKTEHHGRQRIIPLGPRARAVIEPFLVNRPVHAYLFSPVEAETERNAARHAARKTPASCGNAPGKRHPAREVRVLGDCYDRETYTRAIARGCQVAFPPPAPLARLKLPALAGFKWEPLETWRARLGEQQWAELEQWQRDHHWHPHQLRHTYGTQVRKAYGLEIAQILLGHAKADVTQIYAERDLSRAMEVARKIG